MTEQITLPYGQDQLTFSFTGFADILTPQEPAAVIDSRRFSARLNDIFSSAAFDLARPVVVVADKTRLCGYPQYLPVLLQTLTQWGALPENIRILIAYGTHARQSEAECLQAYGACYSAYSWIHHDCTAARLFKDSVRTRRGTPVRLRPEVLEASCLITFGAIAHHYFAGYGGGRKLVFPGLGERQAIYANHGLFLDRDHRRLAVGCRSGLLDGNPLAEDLAEVESHRPADLAIHGILDSHGRVCNLLVGRGVDDFRKACALHAVCYETSVSVRYDLVLASCGGFPKDINFIQSHKALHHAADFVSDQGRLILLAHCPDGIGSQTFLPWFELGGWEAAFDRLAADYVGNGGTALAMMDKLARIRISLVTGLDQAAARRIGFQHLTVEQAQQAVAQHQGSLAVIPNAGMLVCKPHDGSNIEPSAK
jgi:nickel-dependent lactate racemase